MHYHFISGLPRSGSTLLASLLIQNPAFRASIMTPLGKVITGALEATTQNEGQQVFLNDLQRTLILQGVFDGFYTPLVTDAVTHVFDNNRRWCGNLPLIHKLYPDAKVICMLRDPAAIMDSFERLFSQYGTSLSNIYGARANTTVYSRVQAVLEEHGVLGYALNAFREAFYGPYRSKLILFQYDDLARFPKEVMDDLHEQLGLDKFPYDPEDIKPIPGAAEFDRLINTPGLHSLRSRVEYKPRDSILPPDLWEVLPKPFWVNTSVTKDH